MAEAPRRGASPATRRTAARPPPTASSSFETASGQARGHAARGQVGDPPSGALDRRDRRELQRAGIECRVLKGPALANLDYPSPELRPFVHVNLLVRSAQFVDAIELLKRRIQRTHAEPAAGFDAGSEKEPP